MRFRAAQPLGDASASDELSKISITPPVEIRLVARPARHGAAPSAGGGSVCLGLLFHGRDFVQQLRRVFSDDAALGHRVLQRLNINLAACLRERVMKFARADGLGVIIYAKMVLAPLILLVEQIIIIGAIPSESAPAALSLTAGARESALLISCSPTQPRAQITLARRRIADQC
jgi:hypothetical protein